MTHSDRLPQMRPGVFLTDGGVETWLMFQKGFDPPCFAAFALLREAEGEAALRSYYERFLTIARECGAGFILESPTWRASRDWGAKLGFTPFELRRLNLQSIEMMAMLRTRHGDRQGPIVVSGCVGPRGDGYRPGAAMNAEEAADYHREQIRTFRDAEVDLVTAITMTNAREAIGVANAAREAGLACAISFTVETDGRLPTGETIGDAIEAVDAATGAFPAYFMLNCAHPSHFASALKNEPRALLERIRGVRCNASRLSHAELDNAATLDEGDPEEWGALCAKLTGLLPQLNIFGGCCGTDHRHVACLSYSLAHRDARLLAV